jgi:hypothetical protein
MTDDELASGEGTRQWLIEYRLYGIQSTLYLIALLLFVTLLHDVHPEWAIWH